MTMMRNCEAAFAIVDISSKKMKWDEMRGEEKIVVWHGDDDDDDDATDDNNISSLRIAWQIIK